MDHILGEKTKSRSHAVAEHSKRNENPSANEVPSPVAVDAEVEMPPAPAAVSKKKKKKNTPYASDSQPDDLLMSWLIDTGSPFDLIGRDELPFNAKVRKIKGQALLIPLLEKLLLMKSLTLLFWI